MTYMGHGKQTSWFRPIDRSKNGVAMEPSREKRCWLELDGNAFTDASEHDVASGCIMFAFASWD